MIVLFYITLAFIFAPFIGYAILYLLPSKKETVLKANEYQNVSVIIPCYNEEKYIKSKIDEIIYFCNDLYKRDYEIIIISDGSTDTTNSILDTFSVHSKIQIIKLEKRKGKANALNKGVEIAQFELLIFSDVRQRICSGDLNDLLGHFSDMRVGAVSSTLQHKQKSLLRNFINRIKQIELKSGSTIGVYGALYSIRKKHYHILNEDVILDDLLISLQVINQGKLVIKDTSVIIEDIEIDTFYNKTRVIRMINGLCQLLLEYFSILKKLSFRYLLLLYCQKYYKLLLPFLIILLPIFAWAGKGIASTYFIATIFLYFLFFCYFFHSIKFIVNLGKYYFFTLFFKRLRQTVLWNK